MINTYNASQYLRRVLDSVKRFDEIVVCDMESTDDTLAIAAEYGCKTVTFPKGNHNICEVARDFAIHSASNSWVLVVDADEIVPDGLREYLYGRISDGSFNDALAVGRRNPFMGRYIDRHPDYQLRFFRQDKASWPPVIHSRPVIDGKVHEIPARDDLMLEHLYDPSLSARFMKMNVYTDYEMRRRLHRKYPVFKMLLRPVVFFLKAYVMKGGFRHGKRGVINSYMTVIYQMMLMSKITERQMEGDGETDCQRDSDS